jgi:hypothetical protein
LALETDGVSAEFAISGYANMRLGKNVNASKGGKTRKKVRRYKSREAAFREWTQEPTHRLF